VGRRGGSRRGRTGPPPARRAVQPVEEAADGDWVVRPLTGSATDKTYRCPGCDQEIRPGQPHLVCWRAGDEGNRRHWHRPCWLARDRRRPR
jgi:hypothetical protein